MRSRMTVTMVLFAAALAATSNAAVAADPQVDVQFVVLKTPISEVRLEADALTAGTTTLACGRFTAHWGKDSLEADNGELRVNGEAYGALGSSGRSPAATLSVLSTPRIRTALGASVQLKTGGVESAQYLERDPDGRFSLKTMQVNPELDLELTLTRGRNSRTVRGTLTYRLVQLGRRTPIPGVSLDVGAPEVREMSAKGAGIEAPLGEWCLIRLGDSFGASLSTGLALLMQPSLAP